LSARIRPSHPDDIEAIYEMAKLTGGGFTNLPPDRDALNEKLAKSAAAFAKNADEPGDDLYLLVLENGDGVVRGTAQIFSKIGQRWPFYSYRIGTLSQASQALGRAFRAEMLNLTTDYEGSSEVGGLFLHPRDRAGGFGALLARSRYLFIAMHRARFADRIIAELRGVIDEAGGSPFWDGLAGRFFGMNFQDADQFNAVNGNQFIADLMPKHPIYLAMLSETARAVIGLPHPTGRAAMRMLEAEGFHHDGYVDIFDGGPTMAVATDKLRTIREASRAHVAGFSPRVPGGLQAIVATGRLQHFRAGFAMLRPDPDGIRLATADGEALGLREGDAVMHIAR